MKSVTRRDRWLFGALVIWSFVPVAGGLVRLVELSGGPMLAPVNPRAIAAPLPIMLHVISSVLFCVGGAAQVLTSVRQAHPVVHRMLGRLVAPAGIIAAASGLWMTVVYVFPPGLQGVLLYTVRLGVGTGMIALIVYAVLAVRVSQIRAHRAAMLRAFALGQGASTQSVLGISVIILTGIEPVGFERDVLMTSAWVINLVIVELILRRTPQNAVQHA